MSTETAPDQITDEETGHVANPSGMGGTSAEEGVRADGADTTEEGQEQQGAEGAEPEASAERTGEEPASRDDETLSETEQRIAQADAISRTILADPARLREYRKWLAADSGVSEDDRLSTVEAEIEQRFPRQADRDAVRSFVGPIAQELRDLREQMRTMRPIVEQSSKTAAMTELARSLEANGISAETQRTPEFRKFLARERRDADMGRDLTRRPTYAGKNLARGWMAQTGMRARRAADNRRTAELRDGRLHNGVSPSRGGAERVTVIDKSEPGWDIKLLNARLAAEARGEKFKHTYATPKK